MAFRKILIAVDQSAVGAHAAEAGAELARSLQSEAAFIYVVDPTVVVTPDSGVTAETLMTLDEQDGKRLLSGLAARLALDPPALQWVERGQPVAEIVSAAKAWPADLIVVGSHGRGGLQRALLGSVAEGVMRHAPCPVLVIKAKS